MKKEEAKIIDAKYFTCPRDCVCMAKSLFPKKSNVCFLLDEPEREGQQKERKKKSPLKIVREAFYFIFFYLFIFLFFRFKKSFILFFFYFRVGQLKVNNENKCNVENMLEKRRFVSPLQSSVPPVRPQHRTYYILHSIRKTK